MLYARKIIKCGRKYHFQLPAEWCRRNEVRPGRRVLLRAQVDSLVVPFWVVAVRGGRGLHATVPRAWRESEGLTHGDWIFVVELEAGILDLQVIEGLGRSTRQRRHEVLMRRREAQAREAVKHALLSGFNEGYFRRANEWLGIFLRDRACFDPDHAPGKGPESSA